MNTITIHGNVGQEPELKFTPSGMAVVTFTIADTYGRDDKKKTTWHNVTAFSKLAENIAASINKGDSIVVTGRLEQEEYTKKDGTKGKSTRVIADEAGVSLRWNAWVKDQTEKVMAQIGKVFPESHAVNDDFF